jgi:hypothetical protein
MNALYQGELWKAKESQEVVAQLLPAECEREPWGTTLLHLVMQKLP